MNPELGNLIKTVAPPESAVKQAPLWRDILVNLIPVAVVGFMVGSLLQGAGLEGALPWLLGAAVTVISTVFSVYTARCWRKRFAESCLYVQENGVSGVCPANAYKTRSFSVPYEELKNAVAKKQRLTLKTITGPIVVFADNAETLAAELLQRLG